MNNSKNGISLLRGKTKKDLAPYKRKYLKEKLEFFQNAFIGATVSILALLFLLFKSIREDDFNLMFAAVCACIGWCIYFSIEITPIIKHIRNGLKRFKGKN